MALRSLPRALLRGGVGASQPSHARPRAAALRAAALAPARALATASAASDGPVYVVFGATGGIGSELSRLLHASGARLTLVGRSAKLSELAASLPGVHAAQCANAAAAGEADAAIAATLVGAL